MYLVRGKETGLPAYLDTDLIVDMKKCRDGSSPYFRVYLKNEKEHHEYFLDILATEEEINELKRMSQK